LSYFLPSLVSYLPCLLSFLVSFLAKPNLKIVVKKRKRGTSIGTEEGGEKDGESEIKEVVAHDDSEYEYENANIMCHLC
jgi:hypothetical protein